MTRYAALFLHQGDTGLHGGRYPKNTLDNAAKAMAWDNDKYAKIIARETGLSVKRVKEMMEKETIIRPAEAKQLGFVHDILPSRRR